MHPLIWPLFVQVLFTFVLLYWMGFIRVQAIVKGEVRFKDIALGALAWPEKVQRVSNCFHNQLETPLLFYIGVLVAMYFKVSSMSFVILSWMFVITRFGHAYVEIKTNFMPHRFRWFLAGATTLLCFWLALIAKVISLNIGG